MVLRPTQLKRILPLATLALIATLAFAAFAAASASATVTQWHTCDDIGGGKYTDSACQSAGAGRYDWALLDSTPTYFGTGGGTFTLKGVVNLANMIYTCEGAEGIGSVVNPGSRAGTLSFEDGAFVLYGCTAETKGGIKCEVDSLISFKALSGVATSYGGGPAVQISATGRELATFRSKCLSLPTSTVTITGSLYATLNPATSSLEITEASSSGLKVSNARATLAGTTKMVTWYGEKAFKLDEVEDLIAPVNTALPEITPTNPTVGSRVATTNGSWTGGRVASYSYSWQLCDAAGAECEAIGAGGAGSIYTPSAGSEGHTLRVRVTAKNAAGSVSATSAATGEIRSSTSGTRHWQVCQEVASGTGTYEDADCYSEGDGKGDYDWVDLTAGSSTAFVAHNTTPFQLYWNLASSRFTIECATESGGGTVVNPRGGGAGTISANSSLLSFSDCELIAPPSCTDTLVDGLLPSSATGGAIAGEAFSIDGTPVFQVNITNGRCMVSGSYGLSGSLAGSLYSTATTHIDLSGAQPGLRWPSTSFSTSGTLELQTEDGGPLRYRS